MFVFVFNLAMTLDIHAHCVNPQDSRLIAVVFFLSFLVVSFIANLERKEEQS